MRIRSLGRHGLIAVAVVFAALAIFAAPAGAAFGQLKAMGSPGSGDGEFEQIRGIATAPARTGAPDGQLFVAANGTDSLRRDTLRIQEFNPVTGQWRRTIASETGEPATGLLADAFAGMATDPTSNVLYVAKDITVGAGKDHIEKYSLDTGARLADFDPDTGALNSPGPIVVDKTTGDVFVAGSVNNGNEPRIQKYNSAGQLKGIKFGDAAPEDGPTAEGKFNAFGIDGFAVRHVGAANDTGSAKVYVLDVWQDDPEAVDPADDTERVQRFTVTGDNSPGTDNDWSYDAGSQFKSVADTATDVAFIDRAIDVNPANGDLYLTMDDNQEDPVATGIIQVTEGGTEVRRWGARGIGTCQFAERGNPIDIKLDPDGNVFGADKSIVGSSVERVLKFGEGGTGCGFDPKPPNAFFTFTPAFPAKHQNVQFDASGSTDPDGSIANATFKWDLDGNGSLETNTGNDPHASKTYNTAGPVDVKLEITDEQAQTGTFTQTVNIGHPPVANFTMGGNPATVGETVSFNGSGSTDDDGSIAKYEWDLGTGSFANLGSTPTEAFSSPGVMTIKLKVTDDDGLTNTKSASLTITPAPGSPPPVPAPAPAPAPAPSPGGTVAPKAINKFAAAKKKCKKVKNKRKRKKCLKKVKKLEAKAKKSTPDR